MAKETEDGYSTIFRNNRWHLRRFGRYLANFEYEAGYLRALNDRRQGADLPLPEVDYIENPDYVAPKKVGPNGLVELPTGYWKVYDQGLYLGTFRFKLTAQQHLNKYRKV